MKKIYNNYIKWFIENSLKEDVGEGDHTSNACIPEDSVSKAKLL
ncbi:MAG TPA: nicotinate-nucleotide diphosphorylase (carboxylating), partial [Bacteroidetes bacterium]|nr:nicotinate-nucleotide diphosphorylase (carboxylating) [Bacteroidota bacterium]